MPNPPPAYLWYPERVLLSRRVNRLSAEEECWYRRALDFSWRDEGIPADPDDAAERIGKGCTAEAARKILDEFFISDRRHSSKKVNETQELLRKKWNKKISKLSKAGKVSGRKRREKKELTPEQMMNNCSTNDEHIIKYNVIKDKEKKEELSNDNSKKADASNEACQTVFENWQKLLNHPGAKLDKKRKAKILAALREFPPEELLLVPLGVLKSPHHMGDNAQGTKYDDIVTIYRDVPQIEKFIALSKIEGSRVNGTSNGNRKSGERTDADVARQSAEFIKRKFDLT